MRLPVGDLQRSATNLLVIDLSLSAYRKLMAALAATRQEVSGLGIVSVTRDGTPFTMRRFKHLPRQVVDTPPIVFHVDDVALLDKGSGSYTEIAPRKVAEYISTLHQRGISAKRLRLWWHRHPLPRGWSSTDEQTARHEPLGNPGAGPRIGWALAIVYCTETGWNARYDQWEPDMTLEVPLTVEGEQVNHEAAIQHALKAITPRIVAVRTREEPASIAEWAESSEDTLCLDHADDHDERVATLVAEAGYAFDMTFIGQQNVYVAWDVANAVARLPLTTLRQAIIDEATYHHLPRRMAEAWAEQAMQHIRDEGIIC